MLLCDVGPEGAPQMLRSMADDGPSPVGSGDLASGSASVSPAVKWES